MSANHSSCYNRKLNSGSCWSLHFLTIFTSAVSDVGGRSFEYGNPKIWPQCIATEKGVVLNSFQREWCKYSIWQLKLSIWQLNITLMSYFPENVQGLCSKHADIADFIFKADPHSITFHMLSSFEHSCETHKRSVVTHVSTRIKNQSVRDPAAVTQTWVTQRLIKSSTSQA